MTEEEKNAWIEKSMQILADRPDLFIEMIEEWYREGEVSKEFLDETKKALGYDDRA